MKRLTLGALALLLSMQGAIAADLTITTGWTRIRARPAETAATVALAFGNDVLPVLRTEGAWIAVRLRGGRTGWVAAADTGPVPAPATAAPASPQAVPVAGAGGPAAADRTLASTGTVQAAPTGIQ